jgi:hypothetical protein
MTPTAPAQSRVTTTPRRSTNSTSRAAPKTAYCQGWVRARASGMAEPKMAPMAAGPAPSRNPRAQGSLRSWPKRCAPSRTNAKDGLKATTEARMPPTSPAAA